MTPKVAWRGESPLMISNSEIQTFKSDRRRWYLGYYRELGLKREHGRAVGARELGSRVHLALHALYAEQRNPLDALDAIYAQDIAEYQAYEATTAETVVALQKEQDLAKTMISGFLEWRDAEGIDDGMELLAAETVVEVPMGDEHAPGVVLRGKLDQRWHRKIDGAKLFRDWKTVGNFSEPQKLLPMDEQMKFYHLLEYLDSMSATGKEPQWRTDGGQYLMLRKVKRTATATPPFYLNIEVHHNMAELRSMWWRVLKLVEEIVSTRQALDQFGGLDPNVHQYWCPPRPARDVLWMADDFLPIYSMMDDGSNVEGLIAEYYTHVDPHERYNIEDANKSPESPR